MDKTMKKATVHEVRLGKPLCMMTSRDEEDCLQATMKND